jgi:peptide/nickel transport system ATP-binding protein
VGRRINIEPDDENRGLLGKAGVVRALEWAADEPVSSLDVSVRAAITKLLTDIQRNQGTTLLMISHVLGLVRYMVGRVVVMYLGQVMESGTTEEVFYAPWHPYTEALLSAIPLADAAARLSRIVLQSEIPSALSPPGGCPFHTRCRRKIGTSCETQKPVEQRLAQGSHRIVCGILRTNSRG